MASGAIHLDLYLTGYRTIPTIGWLFLLQVIAAFALAVLALAALWLPGPASLVANASGALFALSTLGGYLLSLRVGLFGFREVRTTAGIVAGVIDVAAFAALAVAAMDAAMTLGVSSRFPRRVLPAALLPTVGVVSVVALALLGADVAVGQGGSGSPSASAGQVLGVTRINGTPVLTNAKGLTLYWFAPDTASASHCTGDCAVYWPPVFGKPMAGAGVTGRIGTITRPDGTTQATYDGHPLYTYIADSAPGQAKGNKINLNGGLWYQVTP